MLPGGKFESGEPVDNPGITATRKVSEELGVNIELSQLRPWNIARVAAANEAGFEVVGHYARYVGELTDELANVQPCTETEEVRQPDPRLPTGRIAPMLVETTLPRLREGLPQFTAGREQPQCALSSLVVFCGSGFGNDPAWRVTVEHLGQTPVENRVELAYNDAAIGLIGTVASASLDNGGSVTGVIPEALVKKEVAHPRLIYLGTVVTMADRKSHTYELGDAFVTLPGGVGTLKELLKVWTQQHLGIHAKLVVLPGPSDFQESLLTLLRNVVDCLLYTSPSP